MNAHPAALYTWKVNPLTAWLYRTVWDRMHPETRFVFCATTGRSGTGALAELFARIPGCSAHHEAYPIMNGPPMAEENEGRPALAERIYWTRRAPNIRRLAGGASTYVETNHCFIKAFWRRALADLGPRLRVIHLRRHPIFVARSIARIGVPPGTEDGNWWYLDPEAPENELSRIVPDLRTGEPFFHPFYRSLWYWYEVEARVDRMRREAPEVPVHTLSWVDALGGEGLAELLAWLDLRADRATLRELAGRRTNAQTELKDVQLPGMDRLREMYEAFRARLIEVGHDPARFTPPPEPIW